VFLGAATPELYTLSLHDALPISLTSASATAARSSTPMSAGWSQNGRSQPRPSSNAPSAAARSAARAATKASRRSIGSNCAQTQRSEEHTSELQSRSDLVCRLLLE